MELMPNGITMCHFMSPIQFLTDELGWIKPTEPMIFPPNSDFSLIFKTLAKRLSDLLPRFIETFGKLETLIEYQQRGEGFAARSSHGNLRSAAACILLGHYDDAEGMIQNAVKAGSAPLIKQMAANLRKEIMRHSP